MSETAKWARAGAFDPPPHAHWIETASGRCFDLLAPRAADVHVEDIAHHLAHMCRFNGASRVFYSVAEHSLNVQAALVADASDNTRQAHLWALLHDATEAYLPDVTRPLKGLLPGFREIEAKVLAAVAEAFGLPAEIPPSVKRADDTMLRLEARHLMPRRGHDWQRLPLASVRRWQFDLMSPERARVRFLQRFDELAR